MFSSRAVADKLAFFASSTKNASSEEVSFFTLS
jgi:hypothetical protein